MQIVRKTVKNEGRNAYVLVNNRSEGNGPLTIQALAEMLQRSRFGQIHSRDTATIDALLLHRQFQALSITRLLCFCRTAELPLIPCCNHVACGTIHGTTCLAR